MVEAGELLVQINGADFSVRSGEAALILSGQFHSYRTPLDSACRICIFSTDFLPDLDQYTRNVQTHHPVIPVEDLRFFERLPKDKSNIFVLKALLYDIAARYVSGPIYTDFNLSDDRLLYDIAGYIDAHFTEPLTLADLAEKFGYNYRYMSGLINRYFALSFSKVLQQYRVNHACLLLRESRHTITHISSLCGFDTVRSFNRSFKDIMGQTPKEYREQSTT